MSDLLQMVYCNLPSSGSGFLGYFSMWLESTVVYKRQPHSYCASLLGEVDCGEDEVSSVDGNVYVATEEDWNGEGAGSDPCATPCRISSATVSGEVYFKNAVVGWTYYFEILKVITGVDGETLSQTVQSGSFKAEATAGKLALNVGLSVADGQAGVLSLSVGCQYNAFI